MNADMVAGRRGAADHSLNCRGLDTSDSHYKGISQSLSVRNSTPVATTAADTTVFRGMIADPDTRVRKFQQLIRKLMSNMISECTRSANMQRRASGAINIHTNGT